MASSSSKSSSDKSIKSKNVQNEEAGETLPIILDGKFFIYSQNDSSNTKRIAICKLCKPNKVKISGFNNSTSNFVTHLRRKHGEGAYQEYQSHLKNMRKVKQCVRRSNFSQSEFMDEQLDRLNSEEKFNEKILKFFIHSMIPLRAVDDPYFKNIFDNLNGTSNGVNIISSRTLGWLIEDYYTRKHTNIKTELNDVKEVSTTADIWSGKTRSFLGVTAHWLGSKLERKSKTLACRRLSGAPSYDQIAVLLEEIHAEFDLDSRSVLATITVSCENETESDSDNIYQHIKSEHIKSEHIAPHSIELELPVHLRCSAHKLILCVTTDAHKVLRNIGIHEEILRKCYNLWKFARGPESAEIIDGILGHTLLKPDINRWSSLYEGLKQIACIEDKSDQLHEALGLTDVLSANDFEYINEYVRCSKPIAEALDIFQGEQEMYYYGILLPCLVSLRKKLQKLNEESLVFYQSLAENYLESVQMRFSEFFDISTEVAQNAAVAAMSYPRFKDKWISCMSLKHHCKIKSIFKEAVIQEIHELSEIQPQDTPSERPTKDEDSFFEFDDTNASETKSKGRQSQRSDLDAIISQYLADQEKDVSMLHRHPEIRNVFKKYNTPLPSSGPVGRLFSHDIMTNLSGPSGEMFEKRLLLRSNLSGTL